MEGKEGSIPHFGGGAVSTAAIAATGNVVAARARPASPVWLFVQRMRVGEAEETSGDDWCPVC